VRLLAPAERGKERRVVADMAELSVGREAYYTRELATDHEAYLSGHGESPGRWYGAGATSLGLAGEASVAGFQAMFEGRDPTTGKLLGRPHGRNAVPGFDLVLRPTKSVSILYGLGNAVTGRAVLSAHHAGLAEAVGYLDEHLGARRGHGGVQHVSGQGLLAVGFDHRTSREGDPLLHTHLVIANRVQGPDGRWTALDGRDLYRHRLAADAIYRATYQRELVRKLGVEWTPADTHGNRELQGMPEDLVRGFSKRTDRIDAELDRLAADGRERTPRLVKWTVHATRKPKEHETPDTLYGRWRAEAAERGHDPDILVRTLTDRTPNRDQDRTVSNALAGRLFDRLAGPDGLTATASTSPAPRSWSPWAPASTASDGPSWRPWPIGSWLSGRSAWSPTGRWRSAAGPPPTSSPSNSDWSPRPPAGRRNRRPSPPMRPCATP
jgi:conjugative relaxase-like TrwC/TraI family protein